MTVAPVSETAPVTAHRELVRTWDQAEALLASKLPGYESRINQQELARTIQRCLQTGTNLAAQAGTGTGKSFAAMIPGIQEALRAGEPVVVATATKALQGQYALSDLPFLAEALDAEAMGTEIRFAELQGRANYICPAKVAEGPEVAGLPALNEFLEANPEHSGMLSRLPEGLVDPAQLWKLTTSSEECPGASNCPFGEVCFAAKAKEAARDAHVIVVNHAMLAIDAVLKQPQYDENTGRFIGYKHVVLPDHHRVIIDEAHNFENYMTNALGASLTEGTFTALAAQVSTFLDDNEVGRVVAGRARALFATLADQLGRGRDNTVELSADMISKAADIVDTLVEELLRFEERLAGVQVRNDPTKTGRKARLRKRVAGTIEKLRVLSPTDQMAGDPVLGEVVRWIERDGDRVKVGYSPLSVAGFLREKVWSDTTAILLSATLQPAGDEDFIPGLLGLDEYDVFDAGTPFDYPNQAAVYIPDALDPKDKAAWSGGMNQLTTTAVMAANGRALLLFTSRSEMEARYAAISEDLEDAGFPCHIQRPGISVDKLIAIKKEQPESVVFGLKSLMEGISVPGDALRLVIIDKMPFPVPSEVVFAARCRAMDMAAARRTGQHPDKAKWGTGGSFYGLSVPTMSLLLEQAFGRLIRTMDDQGLVIIGDNRMSPRGKVGKPYGRKIYKTLPDAKDLATEREVRQYLRKLASTDEA